MKFESVGALIKFLQEQFAITPPNNIRFKQTKKHGIRTYSGSMDDNIFGLEGFMAYSRKSGLNPYFIQLVGHLGKRNIIALNYNDAVTYASGRPIKKSLRLRLGVVVLAYKGHILGYGVVENKGVIKSPLREKQRRGLLSDILPYPGRNL